MTATSELEQLQMSANAFELVLSNESWFELMHWHPDFYGTGNTNPNARDVCVLLAKQYLTTAMRALRGWTKESQCWCLIDAMDSAQDSIYVHTRNPNRDNFPYAFEDVAWHVSAPLWIAEAFLSDEYVIGVSGNAPELLYWIVEKLPHPLVNADLVSNDE
jgi:hypothetical protein